MKDENEELKKKLKECLEECEQLKKENSKYSSDIKSLNKLYSTTCRSFVGKDLKIKLLEKKFVPQGQVFDCHKDRLGEATIKILRRLNDNRRTDSTFILKCMGKIYESDFEQLKKTTACGRAASGKLSPEKRSFIEDIFIERLSNAQLDEAETNQRFSHLNELINTAINNILRPKVSLFYNKKCF